MQAPSLEAPLISQPSGEVPPAAPAETTWKPLYRVGAVAALLSVAIIPAAVIVFIAWPPPDFQPTTSAVTEWFKIFQDNPVRGLLDFDLLMMVAQVFSVLIMLALFAALRRVSPAFTAIALAFSLIATALYCASNQAFTLLNLSGQYTAASTDAQRSSVVAAGQALLAIYQGTPFDVGYVLGGIATLMISVVMLRSTTFGKATAYIGIGAGVLMFVPATAGTVGIVFAFASLLPTLVWEILIAIRLFHLGGSTAQVQSSRT